MLYDPYEKDVEELKTELDRLKSRIELIEALDKYDKFIKECFIDEGFAGNFDSILTNIRTKFYAWQERYVERI